MSKKHTRKDIKPSAAVSPGFHFRGEALSAALIAAAGLAAYANSFGCSFHFDDFENIVDNPAIRNIDIGAIWEFVNRRVLGNLTFALTYRFAGDNPLWYHVGNFLIHCAASLGAWRLALVLTRTPAAKNTLPGKHGQIVALFTGLLFVTHPIQSQAVTYIVQRLASMAGMWYLWTLALYTDGRMSHGFKRAALFTGAGICAAAGLFTKETLFTLPFALILIEGIFLRLNEKIRLTRGTIVAIAATVLFFFIVAALLGFSPGNVFAPTFSDRHADPELTSVRYLMTQFRVIWQYFALAVIPAGQTLEHDVPASMGLFSPLTTFFGLIGLAGIAAAAAVMRKRFRFISFGILFFLLAMAVDSSVKPLHNVMYEHRMYISLFGISLAVATAWIHVSKKMSLRTVVTILTALVVVYAGLTHIRNRSWKTEISLWEEAVHRAPGKERSHYNYGLALYNAGRYDEAEKSFERSLEIYPTYPEARNNLGLISMKRNDFEAAITLFTEELTVNPGDYKALTNLGAVMSAQGYYTEAVDYYTQALKRRPDSPDTYNNLGNALSRRGNLDDAVENYRKALAIEPRFAEAHYNLGYALFLQDRYDEAERSLRRALELRPDYRDALAALGKTLTKLGREKEAQDMAAAAGKTPSSREFDRANSMFGEGRFAEAAEVYRSYIMKEPNDQSARKNLAITLMQLGDTAGARTQIDAALAVEPSFDLYYIKGILLYRTADTDGAIDSFTKALELNPGHADSHAALANIYRKLGDIGSADRHEAAAKLHSTGEDGTVEPEKPARGKSP